MDPPDGAAERIKEVQDVESLAAGPVCALSCLIPGLQMLVVLMIPGVPTVPGASIC